MSCIHSFIHSFIQSVSQSVHQSVSQPASQSVRSEANLLPNLSVTGTDFLNGRASVAFPRDSVLPVLGSWPGLECQSLYQISGPNICIDRVPLIELHVKVRERCHAPANRTHTQPSHMTQEWNASASWEIQWFLFLCKKCEDGEYVTPKQLSKEPMYWTVQRWVCSECKQLLLFIFSVVSFFSYTAHVEIRFSLYVYTQLFRYTHIYLFSCTGVKLGPSH
jgi:hypothetical protein